MTTIHLPSLLLFLSDCLSSLSISPPLRSSPHALVRHHASESMGHITASPAAAEFAFTPLLSPLGPNCRPMYEICLKHIFSE